MREDNQQLKVDDTSGYSPELIGTEFETETDANFLSKPCHADRLAALISTCLGGGKAEQVSGSRSNPSTATSAVAAN